MRWRTDEAVALRDALPMLPAYPARVPCPSEPSPSPSAALGACPWRMAELEEQANTQENQQLELTLREQALNAVLAARQP